jgi:glutathione S-transferase
LHKTFTPLFKSGTSEEICNATLAYLAKRMEYVNSKLAKSHYFCGVQFSVADAYLFTVLSWSRHVKFDLSPWPAVVSYLERIGARPAVHAALVAEGLIKS